MTDKKFAKKFKKMYERMLKTCNDEDFELNVEQFEKFEELTELFSAATYELGGKIDDIEIIPKVQHGYITATFPLVYLSSINLKKICLALSEASALTIDSVTDGVCISLTIPNVYVKKGSTLK